MAAHKAHVAHVKHVAHLKHIGAAAKKNTGTSAAKPVKYTAAQTAVYNYLKKKYPFNDSVAEFKAWEKAHPFNDTMASLKAWEATHPFTSTPSKSSSTKGSAAARALSLGDVGCCTAEAVAAYLRLQGVPFSDADMLDLFWQAGGHPDEGVPIGRMLHTSGLLFAPAEFDSPGCVILGVDLPGSHAVLATADGWWSWGELHDPDEFPDAVIEEAWHIALELNSLFR